jgi:hypothetical protein
MAASLTASSISLKLLADLDAVTADRAAAITVAAVASESSGTSVQNKLMAQE